MNSPIVVTGMGIVSPLGCGVETVFGRLIAGKSGIAPISQFDTADFPIQIAGMVPDSETDTAGLNEEEVVSTKDRKKIERFTLYAIKAAQEALKQANWSPATEAEQQATATIIGTGIGGFPTITQSQKTLDSRGYKRISPFVVTAFLANLAAGNVSIRFGFKGPIGCPVTACAAGVQAIGDGIRMIRSGEAEVALVGGAEACVDPLSLASFHALKALSTRNAEPTAASRPFDRNRDGFVMGEGAGLLVIETLEHAQARGATPLAILSGYGTTADAFHVTSGPPDGAGAAAAMQRALNAAELNPDEIDYVNAHGTSTPVGDRVEIAGLRNVFGAGLTEIPISSTKSAIGHLLGAAGGVESIFTVMAVMNNLLPPTINLDEPDEDMQDLDLVPHEGRTHQVQHALCNGLGFGGVNACLVVSKNPPA